MGQVVERVAIVEGASGSAIQDLFGDFVMRWRPTARIAGVIAEDHGLPDRTCNAGYLCGIANGSRYAMFHETMRDDPPRDAEACHLDPGGVLAAGEAVCREVTAGCDLVVLSKFGKLEAARGGLAGAFAAAFAAHVPVLTSVGLPFRAVWERAAPTFVVLPASPEAVDQWWRAVRPTAAARPVSVKRA